MKITQEKNTERQENVNVQENNIQSENSFFWWWRKTTTVKGQVYCE